jgi:hypothetical protein
MTYRNADTRIRQAFAALRAEIEAIFGEQPDIEDLMYVDWVEAPAPARLISGLLELEQNALDYAKQPASEG